MQQINKSKAEQSSSESEYRVIIPTKNEGEMVSLKPLLVVCLLAVRVHMQGFDVSVSLEGNEVDIDVESFKDPCDNYQCSIGEKCETVFTPQLMKLPVAHCIRVKQDNEETCVKYSVNTNLFNCKTITQWEKVGQNQCTLRGDQSRTKLSGAEVQFKCHSMTLEPKYMTAIFTCCLPPTNAVTEMHSEASPSPKYQEIKPQIPGEENVAPPSEDTPTEWSITNSLVPVMFGVVALLTIVALISLLLIIWNKNKLARQRRGDKSKMMVATSFVNPSVDHHESYSDWVFNPLDSTDKSLLIVNEVPRE